MLPLVTFILATGLLFSVLALHDARTNLWRIEKELEKIEDEIKDRPLPVETYSYYAELGLRATLRSTLKRIKKHL